MKEKRSTCKEKRTSAWAGRREYQTGFVLRKKEGRGKKIRAKPFSSTETRGGKTAQEEETFFVDETCESYAAWRLERGNLQTEKKKR